MRASVDVVEMEGVAVSEVVVEAVRVGVTVRVRVDVVEIEGVAVCVEVLEKDFVGLAVSVRVVDFEQLATSAIEPTGHALGQPQGVQEAAPLSLYVPSSQGRHSEAPLSLYVPARHGRGSTSPGTQKEP